MCRDISLFVDRALKHRDFKEQISGCALIRSGDRCGFFLSVKFPAAKLGQISSQLPTGLSVQDPIHVSSSDF